jgi:hypothetical protein
MTATPTTEADEPVILGRRTQAPPRVRFQLAWYDSSDREHLETFTARANLDSGSVFAFGSSRAGNVDALTGIQNLLMRALVDDDGVTRDAQPEAKKPGSGKGELVPVDDTDTRPSELADVVWQLPGLDATFPSENLAHQYARENGSSLRRFAALVDDPWASVEQEALTGIVDLIVSAAADRPTKRSGGSSRSRRTPGR